MDPQQDRQNSQTAKHILLSSLIHQGCLTTLMWMSQENYLYSNQTRSAKLFTVITAFLFFKCQLVDTAFNRKSQKPFVFFKSSILKSNFVEGSQQRAAPS